MSTIKLLVFDENAEFRASLEQYTLSLSNVEYKGVATNLEHAVEHLSDWHPDVILYSSELVKTLGIDQFKAIRTRWPDACCLRLTVFDESIYDEFAASQGFTGSVPRAEIEHHLEPVFKKIAERRQATSSQNQQTDDF